MADDARLSGINWRDTFPFTHLFRSFRIAIHPSKLALGLIALLCMYVGGSVLDGAWPVRHLAVPGEAGLYEESGSRSGEFRSIRAARRAQIENAYADKLIDPRLNVVKDREAALAAAADADEIGALKKKILDIRSSEAAAANDQFKRAEADARKIKDRDERNRIIDAARATRDARIKAAYAQANSDFEPARAVRGVGLFHELFGYQAAQVVGVIRGVTTFNWFGRRAATYPITSDVATTALRTQGTATNRMSPEEQGVVRSLINFFAVGPLWLLWEHTVYFVVYGLLFLSVWSVFGGAIARIAAVHVARDEKLSVRAALAFSAGKFLSFLSAPLIPLIIVAIVGLVPLIAGLLASIPFLGPLLNIVMGLLFVLLLAAGFVMTLVLIGTLGGLNLMYPTIAVEGSDSFDAISRSFSYVYARPWRMLFYTLVAVVYGALTYLFVRFFIWLMLALTHRFVGAGMFAYAPSTDPLWPTMWPGPSATGTLSFNIDFLTLRWDQDIAAFFVAFWVYLLIACLGAFAISFYFTSNTIIYYLMRHEVDATEMDDVYLEQSDEDFGEGAPVTAVSGGRAPDEMVVRETTVVIEPPGAGMSSTESGDAPPPTGADQEGASPEKGPQSE